MTAPSIVLGVVLTFGASDGQTLQLSVSLTEASTAALRWGDRVHTSTVARLRHRFEGLPLPSVDPFEYVLQVRHEEPRRTRIPPPGGPGGKRPIRVALYGDSRDGDGPHRALIRAIAQRLPDLMIHTGDVVHTADDAVGWIRHLSAALPLSERTPLILSLGNHELYEPPPEAVSTDAPPEGPPPIGALARAMQVIPPPRDELANQHAAPEAAFHVRVGPALFVSLDSNAPLGPDTPQRRFLEAALRARGDARFVFVSMHHGPLSSGPHGGHPEATDLPSLFERERVTAVLSGHDHDYERLVRRGVTYIVSGGGGAPLYERTRSLPDSQVFVTTYNWVEIELDGDRASLTATSLEGVVLDRAELAPSPLSLPLPPSSPARSGERLRPSEGPTVVLGLLGLLLAATLYVAGRILLGRVR